MTTKNENSFWSETPKTARWKKPVVIIGSIFIIAFSSFGIASAKYGYQNISSFVKSGHFEQSTDKKTKNNLPVLSSQDNIKTPDTDINQNEDNASSNNSNSSSLFADYWSSNQNSSSLNNSNYATPKSYTNSSGNKVESPDYNSIGATARCNDGTYSHSQDSQGSCSSHGGVAGGSSIVAPLPCDQWIIDNYERRRQSIRDAYALERKSDEQSKSQELIVVTRIGEQNIATARASAVASGQPDNAPQVQQAEQALQSSIGTINQKYQLHYNSRDSQMALDINAVDLKESEYTLTCK